MRAINDGPKNTLGLDSEENLEGFVQFLNWLSVISYTPVLTVTVGMLAGVLLRMVRPESAGRVSLVVLALNWLWLRWLVRRFLSPAEEPERFAD